MNWATAKAISGLVQFMRYPREPTIPWNNSRDGDRIAGRHVVSPEFLLRSEPG